MEWGIQRYYFLLVVGGPLHDLVLLIPRFVLSEGSKVGSISLLLMVEVVAN
jgi:hypothetical protein